MPNGYLTDKLTDFFKYEGEIMRLDNDNGIDVPHIELEKMFKDKKI